VNAAASPAELAATLSATEDSGHPRKWHTAIGDKTAAPSRCNSSAIAQPQCRRAPPVTIGDPARQCLVPVHLATAALALQLPPREKCIRVNVAQADPARLYQAGSRINPSAAGRRSRALKTAEPRNPPPPLRSRARTSRQDVPEMTLRGVGKNDLRPEIGMPLRNPASSRSKVDVALSRAPQNTNARAGRSRRRVQSRRWI